MQEVGELAERAFDHQRGHALDWIGKLQYLYLDKVITIQI